ncbi:hypothetical protein C8E04_3440 [Rhodococcus globerulus]|nr:hypothetical protein C8E04_3440 [Rhodococcus globerulus]
MNGREWRTAMASNPTDVSNSVDVSQSPAAHQAQGSADSTPSCPACGHSLESHDPLGIRFCGVTSERNLDRKCICPDEHVSMQHYTRY